MAEIATRESNLLREVLDSRELTHQQKPRLRGLYAGLGPVTVTPTLPVGALVLDRF